MHHLMNGLTHTSGLNAYISGSLLKMVASSMRISELIDRMPTVRRGVQDVVQYGPKCSKRKDWSRLFRVATAI